MNKKRSHNAGVTLAELMISVTVLALIVTFSTGVYLNFFSSVRNVRAANLVYEEARFTMERIVKEIRNGTVDYEEYYNRNLGGGSYGQNYCQYNRQFTTPGPDNEYGTFDDINTGVSAAASAISQPITDELYLINVNGDRRVYIKRIVANGIGRVGLLQLNGFDYGIDHAESDGGACPPDLGEKDGRIDYWLCADGFECDRVPEGSPCVQQVDAITDDSFRPITPASLDVASLKFIVSPSDDPRKAYNVPALQAQPQVTVRLTARANAKLTNDARPEKQPDITLSSAVSARIYHEIVTECNTAECVSGSTASCPLTQGVCENVAIQTCESGVLPGCSEGDYEASVSNANAGADLYEHQAETLCTDTYDNDCDGLTDTEDPDCLTVLCSNGLAEADEICTDVGGVCSAINLLRAAEDSTASCTDGLDNDCDGTLDDTDTDCLLLSCTDGERTQDDAGTFIEVCPDVGGICTGLTGHSIVNSGEEIGLLCYDGLDNDCSGLADEFDPTCKTEICSNKQLDCGLAPWNYLPQDILTGYEPDAACVLLESSESGDSLDERCVDSGGLCGVSGFPISGAPADEGLFAEDSAELCKDTLDNDCNGLSDGNKVWQSDANRSDPACCADSDGDHFYSLSSLCPQPDATTFPPSGARDCNDTDIAVFPGADEICNDLRVGGEPFDSNCSGSNAVDSGFDTDDSGCCVDQDGDGYGIPAAHIAAKDLLCKYSALDFKNKFPDGVLDLADFDENEFSDCNDLSADIRPSRALAPVYELCDTPADENCNELLGENDLFCLNADGRRFVENFGSADFRFGGTADWNTAGGFVGLAPATAASQDVSSQIIPTDQGAACTSITSVTLKRAFSALPAGATATYQLSVDGGTTWCGDDDCAGDVIEESELTGDSVTVNTAAQTGADLRWSATLFGNGAAGPQLDQIILQFVCAP